MSNKQNQKSKKDKLAFTLWGDPILHSKTKHVPIAEVKTQEFKATIKKMFKMIEGIGVGLAANQIGIGKRFAIIVIEPNPNRPNLVSVPQTAIVNPKIIRRSRKKQQGWEGCLSCAFAIVDGITQGPRFYIERAVWIDVVYTDGFTGKRVERRATGFEAIIFQHEIDHLDGKVCGEQVMVRNGKVVPGAIIAVDWHLKTKGAPPKGLSN